MNVLLKKMLDAKLKLRKELAALPFDKKLELMEKMRERNAFLAESPLRRQPAPSKQTGSPAVKQIEE
jgi:hypothetical protein